MAIIRTNVLGYVIDTDKANQRGVCCEYGTFPAMGDPNVEQRFGPGIFGREQFPFNGFVFDKEAAVVWDVEDGIFGGLPFAVNVRAQ